LEKGNTMPSQQFTTQIIIPTAPAQANELVRKTDMESALAGIGAVDPSSLGTAAYVNTGTTAWTIPVLATGDVLPTSVLPAIAITDVFTAANQAAMLALSTQQGDVAIRTEVSKTFILSAAPATTLANWKELISPTDAVTSVNSKTGVVVLTADDVSAIPTSQKAAASGVASLDANTKVPIAQIPTQTTVSNVSTAVPTGAAVVSYVSSQITNAAGNNRSFSILPDGEQSYWNQKVKSTFQAN
jgi:hypothetical protein